MKRCQWARGVVLVGFCAGSVSAADGGALLGPERGTNVRRVRQAQCTAQVLRTLQQVVPDLDFDEEAFEDVLAWFRRQGLDNMVVKWRTVTEEGSIERRTPISLHLRDMTLGEILDLMVELVSQEAFTHDARLSYHIAGGVVMISTLADFADELVVRTYDVENLLQKLVFFNDAPIVSVAGGGGGRSRGGSGGGGAPGGSPGGGGSAGEPILVGGEGGEGVDYEANREQMLGELVDAILTVKPQSWKDNGGEGTIAVFHGKLVIAQTIEVHELIGGTFDLGAGQGAGQ